MTELFVSFRDVRISLTPAEQRRLSGIIGGAASREDIADVASASLQKLLEASAASVPLLQDVDVFVLQHLLNEPAVAVDRSALNELLDAWKKAESSLKPAVRVAIRLIDRVLAAVLAVKSKEEFSAWFARDVAKRLTDEQGKFLAMYIDELTNWTALGQADVSDTPHYLESCMTVRSLLTSVFDLLRTSCPSQVLNRIVPWIPVNMINSPPFWLRSMKSNAHQSMHKIVLLIYCCSEITICLLVTIGKTHLSFYPSL